MRDLICEVRTYSEKSSRHLHSYSQLILPIKGNITLKTDKHDVRLEDDHLFYLPPSCDHSYKADAINKSIIIDIPTIYNDDFTSLHEEKFEPLSEKWKAIRFLLQQEINTNCHRQLKDLTMYIINLLGEKQEMRSIKYIHDNIDKQITISQLAKVESFNETYYIEWFKNKNGVTPNQYIQKLRIDKAKHYLRETDLNILNISQLVGYIQQSSLSRIFRSNIGMTPYEYRKKCRDMDKSI